MAISDDNTGIGVIIPKTLKEKTEVEEKKLGQCQIISFQVYVKN